MKQPPIVISYPKSGRTWLRVMLNELGIKCEYTHEDSEWSFAKKEYNKLETDKSEYKGRKVIFLKRIVPDTILSAYHHCVKRDLVYEGSFKEYIRSNKLGFKKVLRYHQIWEETETEHLTITYEQLKHIPVCTMKEVIKYLEEERTEEEIKKVISNNTFDKMKAREKKGEYTKEYGFVLTPKDKNDNNSYKCREGKILEGWKSLDEEDKEYYMECIKEMIK